jgi:hypothetical protein
MARPEGLVQFDKIVTADMRWRYMKKYPYGDGRTGERWIKPSFLAKLTECFVDMGFLCPLGLPATIVSAGPYGSKAGRHGEGRALDIDALHWFKRAGTMKSPRILVTNRYENYPSFYLGVEAHLRKYFGTVLGWHYNAAHKGHWHIDDGSRVGFRTNSHARVSFVQATVLVLWGLNPGPIDGKWGPQTKRAVAGVRTFLRLSKPLTDPLAWQRFLLAASITGMKGIDTLDKSL